MTRRHHSINEHPGVAVMREARRMLRAAGVTGTAEAYQVRMGTLAFDATCNWLVDEQRTANKASIVLDEQLLPHEIRVAKA